jgi:hypothetical protein
MKRALVATLIVVVALPALAADVPNPTLTPGVARSEITAGYCAVDQGCEVDHLISLRSAARTIAPIWGRSHILAQSGTPT